MIKKIKIELIYFSVVLLILAIIQHSDLLVAPSDRISLMIEKQNFLHPVAWAFGVYLVVLIIRGIVGFVVKKVRRVP